MATLHICLHRDPPCRSLPSSSLFHAAPVRAPTCSLIRQPNHKSELPLRESNRRPGFGPSANPALNCRFSRAARDTHPFYEPSLSVRRLAVVLYRTPSLPFSLSCFAPTLAAHARRSMIVAQWCRENEIRRRVDAQRFSSPAANHRAPLIHVPSLPTRPASLDGLLSLNSPIRTHHPIHSFESRSIPPSPSLLNLHLRTHTAEHLPTASPSHTSTVVRSHKMPKRMLRFHAKKGYKSAGTRQPSLKVYP